MLGILKFLFPKDKNLFKKVFILATPVIISNISRVSMGIIDMAMIGHLGGALWGFLYITQYKKGNDMATWFYKTLNIKKLYI